MREHFLVQFEFIVLNSFSSASPFYYAMLIRDTTNKCFTVYTKRRFLVFFCYLFISVPHATTICSDGERAMVCSAECTYCTEIKEKLCECILVFISCAYGQLLAVLQLKLISQRKWEKIKMLAVCLNSTFAEQANERLKVRALIDKIRKHKLFI